MQFRELTVEHRAEVVDLWERCGLIRPWNPPEDDVDRALAGSSSAVLGLLDDGRLLATVMVGDDGHRGWIYYLAVDPGRSRQGLGGSAIRAAERWLTDRGVRKVELMVRDSNLAVLDFYEAVGYRPEPVTVLSRWLVDPDS